MAFTPKRLSAFVPKLTREAFGGRGFHRATVLTDWPAIVGPRVAARTCPEKIGRAGTLVVRAAGAFAVELQHMEPVLLERIATHFGYRAVTRLAIRQGPLPERPAEPPQPRPLSADEARALDDQVAAVPDDGLRAALASLGRAVRGLARRP